MLALLPLLAAALAAVPAAVLLALLLLMVVLETSHSECFCRKEDLDERLSKEHLHHLLNNRQQASMMDANATLQKLLDAQDLHTCTHTR